MKKFKIIILIIQIFIFNSAFCQNWQWVTSAGGQSSDLGAFSCMDNAGNLYIAAAMQFPVCYYNTDSFIISGLNDNFISKYNSNGNEIWTKQFGGNNNNMTNLKSEGIADMIYDPVSNCIYTVGKFYESCIFGVDTLSTFPDELDYFLSKLDLNGNFIWTIKAGSNGDEGASKLTVDSIGNIFMEGSLPSLGFFDTIAIPAGGFLAKIDSNGTCQWVKHIFQNKAGFPIGKPSYSVANIKYFNHKIFMYGYATDTLTIDTMQLVNSNYFGTILSCWDENGNILWANRFSGPSFAWPGKISLDNSGNIYLSGAFSGGYATFGNDTLYSVGSTEMYVAKYDFGGNKQWLKQTNANQNIISQGTFTDGDGNTYFTGFFNGSASFGTFTINANTTSDIFLARYNSNGDCLGVRHAGEGSGFDVISDATGSAYVTGEFKNTVSFDNYSLTSYGDADMFIAKIDAFTGIGEVERKSNTLNIYANPTTGKCTVTIPDDFKNENKLTLSIYDNNGKLIQQKTLEMNEGKIKLNLESEAKGVYNVILSNGKKSYNGKIVFE